MKLSEIERFPKTGEPAWDQFPPENREFLFFGCGKYKIYRNFNIHRDAIVMYTLQDGDLIVAYAMGEYIGKVYHVKLARTIDGYQRKGLMTTLYVNLLKNLNIKIASDVSQTEGGWRLWQYLRTQRVVTIYDTITHETIPDDGTIPDNVLFTDSPSVGPRFYFIAEIYLGENNRVEDVYRGIKVAPSKYLNSGDLYE